MVSPTQASATVCLNEPGPSLFLLVTVSVVLRFPIKTVIVITLSAPQVLRMVSFIVEELVTTTFETGITLGKDDPAIPLAAAEHGAELFVGDAIQRERVAARASAIHLAKRAGLSDLEIQMASQMAEARIRAKATGLTEAEQYAVAERAAIKIAQQSGVSQEKIDASLVKIKRSLEAGMSAEEMAGIRARTFAEKNGKSLLEQELAAQTAMLSYRARKQKASPTAEQVAIKIIEARIMSQALDMSGENTEIYINDAEEKAYTSLGLTKNQYEKIGTTVEQLTKKSSSTAGKAKKNNRSNNAPMDNDLKKLQQNVLKLDIKIGQLESNMQKLSGLESKFDRISEHLGLIEKQQMGFRESFEAALRNTLNSSKEALAKLSTEVGKLRANQGWLSNRQCESEAILKHFVNVKACESIYAKISQSYQEASGNKKIVELPLGTISGVNNSSIQNDSAPAFIPKTIQTGKVQVISREAQNKLIEQDKQGICAKADTNWVYRGIWDGGATIERFDGFQEHVSYGSKVTSLGEALFFQTRKDPKFIQFENGIVCNG